MKWLLHKRFLLFVKIAITITFVVMVNRTISFKQLFSNSPLTPLVFGLAILFSIATQFLMILRWHYSLQYFGAKVSLRKSCTSYFAGSVLAAITPGRAGELFRGMTLEGVSKVESGFVVVFERFVAMAILFLVGALFSFLLPVNYSEAAAESGLWVPKLDIVIPAIRILGAVSLLALIIVPRILGSTIRRFWGRGHYALVVIVLSLFIHGFLLIQTAILLHNCGVVSYSQGLTVSAETYSAMQMIPITIGNMGIRESYLQLFSLGFTDITLETLKVTVLSVSLTIMFVNLILPALPGLFVLLTYHLNNKDVRKIGNN